MSNQNTDSSATSDATKDLAVGSDGSINNMASVINSLAPQLNPGVQNQLNQEDEDEYPKGGLSGGVSSQSSVSQSPNPEYAGGLIYGGDSSNASNAAAGSDASPIRSNGTIDTQTLAGAGLMKDKEQQFGLKDNREDQFAVNTQLEQSKRIQDAQAADIKQQQADGGGSQIQFKGSHLEAAYKENAQQNKDSYPEFHKLHEADVKDGTATSANNQMDKNLQSVANDPNYVENQVKADYQQLISSQNQTQNQNQNQANAGIGSANQNQINGQVNNQQQGDAQQFLNSAGRNQAETLNKANQDLQTNQNQSQLNLQNQLTGGAANKQAGNDFEKDA